MILPIVKEPEYDVHQHQRNQHGPIMYHQRCVSISFISRIREISGVWIQSPYGFNAGEGVGVLIEEEVDSLYGWDAHPIVAAMGAEQAVR